MKLKITAALFTAALALAACQPTPQNQAALGAVVGGATGLAIAELTDANPQWTAVAVIGGAAAGSVIAQNQTTRECAYADGRGGYYTAPCR
ncbi:glycine zipper 2TM domain-containing protein [Roseicyclus persicicus]|uniref:17 kDa surface antigen n=1 Tax=Roseicyclus persicicus TaxID=2650661 RepID=A0A7X6GXN4_9RHOB|nr:glucose-6-phosphate isomerase [Roseibacterium persicicum]NKX44300.1 glucose-6-phosphate isomerase [Roseibacterium persicicum]